MDMIISWSPAVKGGHCFCEFGIVQQNTKGATLWGSDSKFQVLEANLAQAKLNKPPWATLSKSSSRKSLLTVAYCT
jgi:hypothetical protein